MPGKAIELFTFNWIKENESGVPGVATLEADGAAIDQTTAPAPIVTDVGTGSRVGKANCMGMTGSISRSKGLLVEKPV